MINHFSVKNRKRIVTGIDRDVRWFVCLLSFSTGGQTCDETNDEKQSGKILHIKISVKVPGTSACHHEQADVPELLINDHS